MEDSIWGFIYYIIFVIPLLLIYLTGFALSIVYRQRLGKVAIFAMAAFLVFSLGNVISLVTQAVYYFYLLPSHNYAFISTMFKITRVVGTLILIIGFILLFVALFAKRSESDINEPPLPNPNLT